MVGSSFLPGGIIAAFLSAQFEEADRITNARLAPWQVYHELLASLEGEGLLRRPIIPVDSQHNAHIYNRLLSDYIDR